MGPHARGLPRPTGPAGPSAPPSPVHCRHPGGWPAALPRRARPARPHRCGSRAPGALAPVSGRVLQTSRKPSGMRASGERSSWLALASRLCLERTRPSIRAAARLKLVASRATSSLPVSSTRWPSCPAPNCSTLALQGLQPAREAPHHGKAPSATPTNSSTSTVSRHCTAAPKPGLGEGPGRFSHKAARRLLGAHQVVHLRAGVGRTISMTRLSPSDAV